VGGAGKNGEGTRERPAADGGRGQDPNAPRNPLHRSLPDEDDCGGSPHFFEFPLLSSPHRQLSHRVPPQIEFAICVDHTPGEHHSFNSCNSESGPPENASITLMHIATFSLKAGNGFKSSPVV